MTTITVDFQTKDLGEICKQGEHNQVKLIFILPVEYNDVDYINVEFEKSNGNVLTIEKLIPNNNTVTVDLTSDLTDIAGQLNIQLAAYKDDNGNISSIARSLIITASIRPSIGRFFSKKFNTNGSNVLPFLEECASKVTTLWANKHSHSNLDTLDGFDFQINANNTSKGSLYYRGTLIRGSIPVNNPTINPNGENDDIEIIPNSGEEIEIIPDSDESESGIIVVKGSNNTQLTAGTVLLYDEPVSEDIVIESLVPNNYQYPEYLIDFVTGETTYSLSLPGELKWVKELVILPNYHYQISIRNGIILWCAVDISEEDN